MKNMVITEIPVIPITNEMILSKFVFDANNKSQGAKELLPNILRAQ